MREFTREERKAAARTLAQHTKNVAPLRESTLDLIAEAWTSGEETYSVSNQFAIQLQCELTEARKNLFEIFEMKRIEQGITNSVLDILRGPPSTEKKGTE